MYQNGNTDREIAADHLVTPLHGHRRDVTGCSQNETIFLTTVSQGSLEEGKNQQNRQERHRGCGESIEPSESRCKPNLLLTD